MRSYLDRYGFGIPVDGERLAAAEAALFRPGSFYTMRGGGAWWVLQPPERRLYLVYAG